MLLVDAELLRHVVIHFLHILKNCPQIPVFHILHERKQFIDCFIDLFTVHIVIAPSTIWLLYFSVNIQQGVSGCECDMRIYTPSTLLQKILEKILNGLEFEEVSGIFSLWYYRKSQRWQRREEEQLSEYWDSGLTIQEYSELKELPYESARRWILWLYLLYDFTKSSGYFRWNCNLLTICKRPASSMVMVDRGEIFSKGEMATK